MSNCSQNSSGCNSKVSQTSGCPTLPNICCQGITPAKFNVAKAKTICAYVDRIYDSKVGPGSSLFATIISTIPNYSNDIVITNPNANCCTTCVMDSTTIFNPIDCATSVLYTLTPQTALTAADVLVNGVAVSGLTLNSDGSYTATLTAANGVPNNDCRDNGLGTTSTMLIPNVGNSWQYTAKSIVYGTMNTAGQTCKFKLTVENQTSAITDTATSTFMVQSLCIPSYTSSINFTIGGVMSLINPSVKYSTTDTIPELTATVVITPQINVEVLEKTKVCIQGML